MDASYSPVAFAYGTATATAGSLLTFCPLPQGVFSVDQALISVEGAQIRYTFDGSTPTASHGHPATSGTTLTIQGWYLIQPMQIQGTGGTITVTLEKRE